VSNEGSTIGQAVESPMKGKEALIVTFWTDFENHEKSHRSETFQPLFQKVLDLCENGNEEIAYEMLWSGKAYGPDEIAAARQAKAQYASSSACGLFDGTHRLGQDRARSPSGRASAAGNHQCRFGAGLPWHGYRHGQT
jgi:hypothetical protein